MKTETRLVLERAYGYAKGAQKKLGAPSKAELAAARREAYPELERILAKTKLLPATDKYMRDGILQGLAEVGVLPNPVLAPRWDRFVTQTDYLQAHKGLKGGASEIVLPLAAWRGADGVDWARAELLFGVRRARA